MRDSPRDLPGAAPTTDACTVELDIGGMTCASCVARVERAITGVAGVRGAEVNLATERARVELAPGIAPALLIEAVEKTGFTAALHREPTAAQPPPTQASFPVPWDLLASAALSLPLAAPMLLATVGVDFLLPAGAQLVLASLVQFLVGARFYRSAWHALRTGGANMDVLVALGTSAAWGLSVYGMWRHGAHAMDHLYFESSAVVITLVLLGKWIEGGARRRTGEAIRALHALRPLLARIERDGQPVQTALEQVRPGDRVIVLPGERIPVDGRVLEGRSHADESLLTGESLPVARGPGDLVIGGAMNGEGRLLIETGAVGAQAALGRIIAMVERAQSRKAPIQRLVDQVSAVFVPAIVAVAAITLAGWWWSGAGAETAIINAVSVLVIACPCAMGLATPTAILVGTGLAARRGILIADVTALERARALRRVVFDKTGTLTLGSFSLVAIEPAPAIGRDAALALAAGLQAASPHPLGAAVRDAARTAGLAIAALDAPQLLAGRGMRAGLHAGLLAGTHAGASGVDALAPSEGEVVLGSERWMQELGVPTQALAASATDHGRQGRTLAWLALLPTHAPPRLLALFAFGDTLRPGAARAVQRLHALGISTTLLSGDTAAAVQAVARAVGIEDLRAGVLPEGKAQAVEELRAQGGLVAMVGDGVNDAPALAAADVGIAVLGASDVALQTAAIALLRPEPGLVPDAIEISRRTLAKIRQNLFWAFAYNVVGVPLAAAGLLSPVIAGAAMALSSITVVGNALLLRRS